MLARVVVFVVYGFSGMLWLMDETVTVVERFGVLVSMDEVLSGSPKVIGLGSRASMVLDLL